MSLKKKPKTTTTTKNLRKRERTQKKTRPDINRIFPNSFRSETPKNKAKTIAKTHQKTQDQHNHPKTKVRSRKFFQKMILRKEERQKNGKRRRTRHRKNKMKKTDSISPLGEQEKGKKLCDSTVAVRCRPPPPSWAVLYGVQQEGGEGGETSSARLSGVRVTGPHPESPKNHHSSKPTRGEGCLVLLPRPKIPKTSCMQCKQ